MGTREYQYTVVYEPAEARDLQAALGRHLGDSAVRRGLLELVRMFPPEPLQPDPEYRGRVLSTLFLQRGMVPLGTMFAGVLATVVGPRIALGSMAFALVATPRRFEGARYDDRLRVCAHSWRSASTWSRSGDP